MPLVPDNPNNRSVAATMLTEGEIVAFPTDTLYGLGAIVFNEAAVSNLYTIKGRVPDQGFPVLIASESQLHEVASEIPDAALALASRFWPGALTIVLRRHERIPESVTGGTDTIAVRLPDHPCPRSLISTCGSPITGTSANRHAGPQPTSAGEVQRQLGDQPNLVLDGGPSPSLLPSTLLDLTASPPIILRRGAISVEDLMSVCSVIDHDPAMSAGEARG